MEIHNAMLTEELAKQRNLHYRMTALHADKNIRVAEALRMLKAKLHQSYTQEMGKANDTIHKQATELKELNKKLNRQAGIMKRKHDAMVGNRETARTLAVKIKTLEDQLAMTRYHLNAANEIKEMVVCNHCNKLTCPTANEIIIVE